MKMKPLIVIAGPTAVGKTDLAIRLAEYLNTEIISADSMQVYKYMNIGTAKPTPEQQRRVTHNLINLVAPDQDFSVADYQELFDQTVERIISAGKIPLVAGGTGLYIRACLNYFSFQDPGANYQLREELKTAALNSGEPDFLHRRLQQVDPITAGRIHQNDSRRIIRALEVFYQTGTPISFFQEQRKSIPKYRTIYILLDRDREELYRRIEARVDLMMEEGLIAEVADLLARGYSPELKSMQSLGYKQIGDYLQKKITLEQAVDLTKQLTRNYAKRQLTWFRKEPVDLWINISDNNREFFGEILSYIEGRISQHVE